MPNRPCNMLLINRRILSFRTIDLIKLWNRSLVPSLWTWEQFIHSMTEFHMKFKTLMTIRYSRCVASLTTKISSAPHSLLIKFLTDLTLLK